MIVPRELVLEAKEKFGDKAIELIREYFQLENWEDKTLKGSCPFGHIDNSPSFIWNNKNNSFHCFSCNRNFGILDLFMKQGLTFLESVEKLFDEVGITFRFGERGLKTKREYKYPVVEYSENRDKVDAYLASRKISKETLDYCNVGQDTKGNIVWKFFDENDTLLTVKLRPSRKIVKNEEKEWYLPNYDNTPILYNMNRVDHTNGPLLITEGQIDTLSAIEAGYFNTVSVPGGTANMKWIENCYDWLETFNQIIIWSDSDDAGIKMRKEVVARLGQWRCKFVEIPEEYKEGKKDVKDANAVLYYYGKQPVLDLINNAQEFPISGVADLSSIDDFNIELAPGVTTGIESLDNIIYKFLFGNVVIVTGRRGEGKSSLVNQLFVCEALNQGYDSFIFSGELSASILKSWINLTLAAPEKIKMKNKFVHIIDSEAKKQMEEWYEKHIWIYDDPKSNKADDILNKGIALTRKYGVKIWVLDNLTVMDIDANDSNVYEKQKDFMTKLIGLANLYNVLIILVVHPKKLQSGMEATTDDVGGSGAITNLSQYVLSAKRFTETEKKGEKDGRGNYKKGKEPIEEDVAISIWKNRFTGRVGEIRMYFDYKSRRFFINEKDLNKRYDWNKDQSPISNYNPSQDKLPESMRN